MIALALCGLLGFLFGSIPFGSIIGQVFFGVDLRKHGSGNIGAANALRTIGKPAAAAVLLLDALKGALAVACAAYAAQAGLVPAAAAMITAGAGAIIGHCFTPWLGFRGGKGVATALGVLLTLWWPAGLAALCVYIAVAKLTKISALGSLAAAAAGAAGLGIGLGRSGWMLGIATFALLIYTHRENLKRLRAGRELTLQSEVPPLE